MIKCIMVKHFSLLFTDVDMSLDCNRWAVMYTQYDNK